jgi:hypothetical protein
VVFRSKAQYEDNGRSLVECWNAAAGHHMDALRVSLSTPMDCVAPLDKGAAIACEARLAYMDVGKGREQDAVALP